MSREVVKVIGDILKSELGIAAGQIMLTNMKWNIPTNEGLFVALSYVSGKAIANNNYQIPTGNGMSEVQEVTMRSIIQIDLLSFDDSARLQKEQVIQSLRSVASQAAQELNGMHIARIPGDFVDASSLEDTKLLNRFTMTIAVTNLISTTKALAGYYNQFPVTGQNDTNGNKIQIEAENAPSF